MAGYSKGIPPVGWYVGSYVLRFIEIESAGNDDQEREFLVRENTVIARASCLDEAYGKVVRVAEAGAEPCKSEPDGRPVRWVFEGVAELLPIHEPREDGAEIMWAEHAAVQLGKLRRRAKLLSALKKICMRTHAPNDSFKPMPLRAMA